MNNRLNESTIWPVLVHKGIPLKTIIDSYNPAPIPHHRLAVELVDYILRICQMKQLSPRSFEGTLYVTSRYISKTNNIESRQLIALVSLMLVSKLFDYFYLSVNEIHDVSNHQFTNKDIHQMEAKILTGLEFNLFVDAGNKEFVKEVDSESYSHTLVYEMMLTVMEMTSIMLPNEKHAFYFQTTTKVFSLYFHMLFTKDIKNSILQKLSEPKYAICVITKISLIILTQSNGAFPQVQWIQQMFGVKRNEENKQFDDEFDELINQVMQTMLGRQFRPMQNQLKSFFIRNN